MTEHTVAPWIYLAAALMLNLSLMFQGGFRRLHAVKKTIDRAIPYFFSLGPAALLCYLLYEISNMF